MTTVREHKKPREDKFLGAECSWPLPFKPLCVFQRNLIHMTLSIYVDETVSWLWDHLMSQQLSMRLCGPLRLCLKQEPPGARRLWALNLRPGGRSLGSPSSLQGFGEQDSKRCHLSGSVGFKIEPPR
jgi:hypothetical protein